MLRSPLLILKFLLVALFIGTLSYNFFVANSLKFQSEGDAENFIELGLSLAKLQKYGNLNPLGSEGVIQVFEQGDVVNQEFVFRGHSTWRPPVWPFIIAGIFMLFGYSLTYILIFKFILHSLGVFIFYKSLRLLKFQDLLIILGTFLYAISPAWQLYSRVFLSEPITLFFITFWLYLLLRFIKGISGLFPQAILGGLLILAHPYYVFLPFSIWLLLWIREQINIKTFLISSILCASVVSIWIIRNFIVLETEELILTTSSGAVMAKGWNPDVLKKHTNTRGDLAEEELVLVDFPYESKPRNEIETMQLYKNATIFFIRSNPEMILPIIGKKLGSAFNPFPETPKPGVLETGRWFFQLLALVSLLYILLFSRNKLLQSLAVGLIISTIGITVLTYSGFRFRMPQVGLEMLFIIFVINELVKKYYKEDSHKANDIDS